MTAERMYIFNPENDMALASFSPYYKMPEAVRRMTHDLQWLPAWYAPYGSVVKTDESAQRYGCFHAGLLKGVRFSERWTGQEVCPWGWSPALIHRLRTEGVDEAILPDADYLEKVRVFSGRQCVVGILEHFPQAEGFCGSAAVCRMPETVERLAAQYGSAVLKAPWSGSGRGLTMLSQGRITPSVRGWIQRILRTQGELMVEPFYQKAADFAMEFRVTDGGELSFAGYSLFETDRCGNYKSNLLASDAEIEKRLSAWIAVPLLHKVRQRLLSVLQNLLQGWYKGCLGIDMMICVQPDGSFALHPCVEINLRMNMGLVARTVSDRYLQPGTMGRYVVECYHTDGEALAAHRAFTSRYPLSVVDGKISSGYLSLTPVTTHTRYQAYVVADAPHLRE